MVAELIAKVFFILFFVYNTVTMGELTKKQKRYFTFKSVTIDIAEVCTVSVVTELIVEVFLALIMPHNGWNIVFSENEVEWPLRLSVISDSCQSTYLVMHNVSDTIDGTS